MRDCLMGLQGAVERVDSAKMGCCDDRELMRMDERGMVAVSLMLI